MVDINRMKTIMTQVFPNGIEQQRIEIKKIKDYMQELDIDSSNSPFENDEGLKKFFLNPRTKGFEVKDLFIKCFQEAGFDFVERAVNRINNKEERCELFFKAFNVYPKANVNTVPPEQNVKSEKQTKQQAPLLNTVEMTNKLLQAIYDKAKKIDKSDVIDITEFTLVEKMPVTLQDEFYINLPEDIFVYNSCIGLADFNTGKVVANGCLKINKGTTHLIFKDKNINYNSFINNRKFKLFLFPSNSSDFFQGKINANNFNGEVYEIECYIDYERLEKTNKTLCIDFGTSNTTAGSYKIKNPQADGMKAIEIVQFLDVTEDEPSAKAMLPTLVYVNSCKNGEVEYAFGYEARKKIIDADYNTEASVFYEIKRWINDIDKEEELCDKDGNKCKVQRRDIIKAYIQNVIDLSEQYFKVKFDKLHFSAPIKLKNNFIREMEKLFDKDYRILPPEASLDEGVAIIYNHIAKRLYENVQSMDEPEKIMILDCGGGTTDLASCSYQYLVSNSYRTIKIKTNFENGDSNFGGNNITFRILQILKIKLAHYLKNKNEEDRQKRDISVQSLITADENEIMSNIDEDFKDGDKNTEVNGLKAKNNIYKDFEQAYNEAEDYIPTRFADCNLKNKKRKIKRNYYYLWQMAEAIKIEFYRINLVVIDFNKTEDRKIYAKNTEQYYLFADIDQSGNLVKYENPMKDIDITINEIRRALCPDIYALLNTLFGQLYTANQLTDYYYKLSGQSCKISLFHELMKEFIPGKNIRYPKGAAREDSGTLKMSCINGCIEYIRDKEYGEIKPEITVKQPKMIYNVYHKTLVGEDKILGTDNSCEVIVLPDTAKKADFIVKDKNGIVKKNFSYEFKLEFEHSCTVTQIQKEIEVKTYLDKDIIENNIIRKIFNVSEPKVIFLFVIPVKNGYGINIYQICKDGDKYYLPQSDKFESFEDENLKTFFDGKR